MDIKEISRTAVMLLANATGAEFEDEELAAQIIENTIVNCIELHEKERGRRIVAEASLLQPIGANIRETDIRNILSNFGDKAVIIVVPDKKDEALQRIENFDILNERLTTLKLSTPPKEKNGWKRPYKFHK